MLLIKKSIFIIFLSLQFISNFHCFAKTYETESVIRLGNGYSPTSVLKINDKGNVLGLQTLNARHQIFFYNSQTKSLIDLEPNNSSYHTYPLDFNNDDNIIGYTDVDVFSSQKGRIRETHIILWKNFFSYDLTKQLGVIKVLKSNQFLSINDAQTLAGFGFELCNKIMEV